MARLAGFTTSTDRLGELECQVCRDSLDLHQPDTGLPYRFLATCPDCGLWYRVQVNLSGDMATVIQLPEVEDLEADDTNGEV